jgi:hypothetical protein
MRFLFLLLSLWALSFAQDNPLRVFVSLTQSAQIEPDIYTVLLTISTEADKELKALSLLGRVDRELSQLGLPYSGGTYWVDRKCFMGKNIQSCQFSANLYQFRLKDVKEQGLIVQKLAQVEGISFTIHGTQWIVSAGAQEAKKQELIFSLLDRATAFTTEISKKLKRECQMESISYDGPLLYSPKYVDAKGVSVSAPQPTKDLQAITVFMRLSLVCR